MPLETFKNAVRLILGPSIAPKVYVQFHGGEPLLQSDDFFREAVTWAREYLTTPTRRVQFFIQTNLTKMTAEREAMVRELDIGISFSLDGPPKVNDELRGGGQMIVKNFRRLHANGTEAGAICLVQPANWDRMDEVLNFFDAEGIRNVRFNIMVPDGRGTDVTTTTADKLYGAKKQILDHMIATEGQGVVDANLYNAMKRFAKPNGAPGTFEYHGCESFYCQAGRSLFSINPDGGFYTCDRIAENKSWAMGNVNQPFAAPEHAKAQEKRSRFHHKDEWWARCEGCDAKKICEFSCSAYYVDKVNTREVECQYTKRMWTHFLARKDEILKLMATMTKPVFIDEKRPLADDSDEARVVKDIAHDAFFNQLSDIQTIASNRAFQLVRRAGQYFLYLHDRQKIFEVDELVAEICRFNGALPADALAALLDDGRFPRGKLRETLARMQEAVPEVFRQLRAKKGNALGEQETLPCTHHA